MGKRCELCQKYLRSEKNVAYYKCVKVCNDCFYKFRGTDRIKELDEAKKIQKSEKEVSFKLK